MTNYERTTDVVDASVMPAESVKLYETKGNIDHLPVKLFQITSSDLVNFIQKTDFQGIRITCDFARWTGVAPEHSYVRMRVVFNASDIVDKSVKNDVDYAARTLSRYPGNTVFKKSFADAIKKYGYNPDSILGILNNPAKLGELSDKGLIKDRIAEIAKFATLHEDAERGLYCIYLKPEAIIREMLSDPKDPDNESRKNLKILTVYGTTSQTISWFVSVPDDGTVDNVLVNDLVNNNIDLDTLFAY